MKRFFIFILAMLCFSLSQAQYTLEDRIYDYIDDHKDLAMQEMETYKVPASITLAQAIYASKVGTSRAAKEANNHFNIMCHTKEWTGPTYFETDNHSPEHCFRKYSSVTESYRDHSLFLSKRSRYVKLFYLPITDYKSWARGLQEAGFSGNPHYADTLISLIEKYYLMHYDRKVALKLGDTLTVTSQPEVASTPVVENKPEKKQETPAQPKPEPQPEPQPQAQPQAPTQTEPVAKTQPEPKAEPKAEPKPQPAAQDIPQPEKVQGVNVFTLNPYSVPFKAAYYPYTSRPVYENNKTKFLIARKGDTYKSLATSMQLSEKNLRLYNDVYDESEPIEDEVVYLEMKSTKSPEEYHILQKGDTYRYIAQKYGIQLKIIIKRNSGAISSYGIGDQICIGCK